MADLRSASEHFFKGLEALNRGDLAAAETSLREALRIVPDRPSVLANLSIVCLRQDRLADALAFAERAVRQDPSDPLFWLQQGAVQLRLERFAEALASLDEALARKELPEALNSRGSALIGLKRLEEALACLDRVIALRPGAAPAHAQRGAVLAELGRPQEALAGFEQAIRLDPRQAASHVGRANALSDLGRAEEAAAALAQAIALQPDDARTHLSRASLLRELERFAESQTEFDAAIRLDPALTEARHGKAHLLLQRGDFAEGFALNRWRWHSEGFPSKPLVTSIPEWDGGPLAGDLLLWAEQGLGDEILFASMMSLIDDVPRITLAADPRLHPIYRRSFPGIRLLDRAVQAEPIEAGFAAQASIGDLGALLKIDAEKIARRRYPFLAADPARREAIRKAAGFPQGGPVCGIAWKSPGRKAGTERGVSLVDYAPLLRSPGLQFVNLQYGDVAADIAEAQALLGIEVHQADGVDVFNDIDGLLALIDACDVVVTSSNVTAHLAGASGKAAAVLVPTGKGRIWYWQGEPANSWYPSLRLFVQDRLTGWNAPIARAAEWVRENS